MITLNVMINPNIFKSYDIRGKYPSEINNKIAFLIALSFAKLFLKDKSNPVIISSDFRKSSPTLKKAVISGITTAGFKVLDIGISTSPMYYFAISNENTEAGIMVTASHNPSEYNGFKICLKGAVPLNIDENKEKILKEIEKNKTTAPKLIKSKITKADYLLKYIKFLNNKFHLIKTNKKIKVVIDASSGTTSIIVKDLFNNIKNIKPFFQCLDYNKKLIHPLDPTKPESQNHLKKLIKSKKADFGIIFDGDGDRVFFMNKYGNIIMPDSIFTLLINNYLKHNEGRTIIYELRLSKIIPELISKLGGIPEICRTGHSHIKAKMRHFDALIGGEISGHYFFNTKTAGGQLYFDSGILAALKIIEIIINSKKTIEQLIKPYKNFYKEEINLNIEDKNSTIEKLKNNYKNFEQEFIDGLTVKTPKFWFNIRPSNTEPIMRLMIEAKNKKLFDEAKKEILRILF